MPVQIVNYTYEPEQYLGEFDVNSIQSIAAITPALYQYPAGISYQQLHQVVSNSQQAIQGYRAANPGKQISARTETIICEWDYYDDRSGTGIQHTQLIRKLVVDFDGLSTDTPISTTANPNIPYPYLREYEQIGTGFPGDLLRNAIVLSRKIYTRITNLIGINQLSKPNYYALLSGYELDSRTIPQSITFNNPVDGFVVLGFLKENIEPIPNLRTIFWKEVYGSIKLNKPITLDITGCVLGTLKCLDPLVTAKLKSLPTLPGQYPFKFLFEDELPALFLEWNTLYNLANTNDSNAALLPEERKLHCLAANNNYWNTRPIPTVDLNFEATHPMYVVDNPRASDWHLSPQIQNGSDYGIGTLDMDSLRTIETRYYAEEIFNKAYDMHLALGENEMSVNHLDDTKKRVTNIAWHVKEQSRVLGISPDDDGKIDVAAQKTISQTQCADIRKPLDTTNYSPYGFGPKGMAIANLPNDHNGSNPVNGGGSLVANLPSLMLELHGQINKSLGIQDGSNIVFTVGDKKVHYPNQVAMLIDLSRTVAIMSQLLSTVYTNSLQTESEVREIIGALGLGTTDDSVGVNINGQSVNIPYKGVDRRESIVNELADIKLTLAVIMGKLI
jgi:hypothetical protein